MKYISNSIEETKKIAYTFAQTLVGCDVVFLEGDIGSGKTTFAQGVLEAFGYMDPVRSPTFSIMNVYQIKKPGLGAPSVEAVTSHIARVIHLDFYRLNSPKEISALGLEEFLENPGTVLLIEWPEKVVEAESPIRYTKRVQFVAVNDQTREIIFN